MKRGLAWILVLMMVLLLAAPAANAEAELTGELTLSVGNSWLAEDATGEAFKKAISQYEELHPGVKITAQGASQQDIKESFQTAALAGGGVDLVIMDNSGHAIDLAAMGLLLPLNQFITDEELESIYQPGPLNSGKFEGVYHSVPWYMDCCGMYCNTDRLNELGLTVPTTWTEFETALDKVIGAGYGGIITYKSAYAFYSYFYQNGCSVIDTTGEAPQVVVDSEAGVEAWNYITRLIGKGALVESFKEATSWDKVYESFANGEATFLLGGDWCKTGIDKINPNLNYSINCMVEGKQKATILGGWTWNINANTKNPALAYDFVRYITSEACDFVLAPEGKNAARADFDLDKALEGKEVLKPLAEQFPYTMARPAIINEKTIDEIITDAILTVVYGQADAEQSMKTLAQSLRDNIKDNYGA
ncbi:sugar ABC transporter substrate-binding protein [Eubacteriales bacterium OttesenSCG-928-N13]|nr:sugar ABC transporter substrate-binding protein [Eubacteriales bacterium OttesenSCG-928-N13]